MNRSIRVTALLMVILMISSIFCSAALAANIYGISAASKTFTVKTGGNWFVAPKVTIAFQKGQGVDDSTKKTVSSYSSWTIKVYDSNGSCVQTKSNYYASSVTISGLKRNQTYKIKVTEDRNHRIIGLRVLQWDKYPAWYVSSTKNINSMY